MDWGRVVLLAAVAFCAAPSALAQIEASAVARDQRLSQEQARLAVEERALIEEIALAAGFVRTQALAVKAVEAPTQPAEPPAAQPTPVRKAVKAAPPKVNRAAAVRAKPPAKKAQPRIRPAGSKSKPAPQAVRTGAAGAGTKPPAESLDHKAGVPAQDLHPAPTVHETPASPLQPKRFEDRWLEEDGALPAAAREPHGGRTDPRVAALEAAVHDLRQENSHMKGMLESLQSRIRRVSDLSLGVQAQPRAQFLPQGDRPLVGAACLDGACEAEPVLGKAMVVSTRAILRAGPNTTSMRLMTLDPGMKVSVELSRGEWLRVVTPHGVRAWLPLQEVAFD